MDQFYINANDEWETKLKSHLKQNLKALGHEFTSDDEFLNFCKERITRVSYSANPEKTYLFLDKVIRLATIEITFRTKHEHNCVSCVSEIILTS